MRHEDLSRNPEHEISSLIQHLGLKKTQRQTARIQQLCYGNARIDLNTEEVQITKRDSRKMIKKWKEILTQDQIDTIRKESREIWSLFYNDEDW